MDENKFSDLIKNDDFIDGLLGCSSREEMRKIFEKYNQTVSEEELDYFVETVEKALQTANTTCSDESMEIVAGGTNFNAVEDAFCRKALFNNAQSEKFNPTKIN